MGDKLDQSNGKETNTANIWQGVGASSKSNLEELMWGTAGVPSVDRNETIAAEGSNPSPVQPYNRNASASATTIATTSSETDNDNNNGGSGGESDDTASESDNNDVAETVICWKLRSGLGKFSVTKSHWERRRVVLTGTKVLYYKLTKEEASMDSMDAMERVSLGDDTGSSSHDTNGNGSPPPSPGKNGAHPTLSPSRSRNNNTGINGNTAEDATYAQPRGVLDLVEENASVQQACTKGAPSAYEIDILVNGDVKWKLCFESPHQGSKWLKALEHIVMDDSREHGFEAGDHIIRWDMIFLPPIIWPIQIHGIVIEAGRNCVIIADFGLTSYGKQQNNNSGNGSGTNSGNGSGNTSTENKEEDKKDKKVTEAYQSLFPKKQRINVIALTDPRQIRQWSKVNYGRNFKKKKNTFDKLTFGLFRKSKSNKDAIEQGEEVLDAKTELEEAMEHIARGESTLTRKEVTSSTTEHKYHSPPRQKYAESNSSHSNDIDCYPQGLDAKTEFEEAMEHIARQEEEKVATRHVGVENCITGSSNDTNDQQKVVQKEAQESSNGLPTEEQPDWFHTAPPRRPRVFTLEGTAISAHATKAEQEQSSKLPKSDPTKIVLARTNFVLENEDLLPPYHVLFSNSECIAVWCKTGRWSTLQTAIWCHVTAVGNAKTSTVIGMGVAAAHVVLVPLIAVGGIMFATAPLLIYKKSKVKWEAATSHLTKCFWERAKPEVFVEAIESWSSLGYTDHEGGKNIPN